MVGDVTDLPASKELAAVAPITYCYTRLHTYTVGVNSELGQGDRVKMDEVSENCLKVFSVVVGLHNANTCTC